jgi:phage FluMu gp28-like protein
MTAVRKPKATKAKAPKPPKPKATATAKPDAAELQRQVEKALDGRQVEDVLLSYQQNLFSSASTEALLVYEKSRRIGITWAVASFAVLNAAKAKTSGGQDVLYLGYALDMTREFIDVCAAFARAIEPAAATVQEFLFDDGSEKGIGAFRIKFASDFEIVALTSKPRSLRGRQGIVIIDEAAFHDDLDEVLKAALALLIWGGSVVVISSHNGTENPFNKLIEDIRAKRRKGKVIRTTFKDALAAGLYKRVCYVTGKKWSPEAEKDWADDIYGYYAAGAAEELDVIPSQGTGTWLNRSLIERRAIDVPVLRLSLNDAFALRTKEERKQEIADWLIANVDPILASLHPTRRCAFGWDFARKVHRSVLWPIQQRDDLGWSPPFLLEMRNVPFVQQEQILFHIVDAIGSRFDGGAMDAGGNGAQLAEAARDRYGENVHTIQLNEGWYRENMPKLKAGLDDDLFDVPRDTDVAGDLLQFQLVKGVARLPDNAERDGSDGEKRHADAGIAAALARYACLINPVAFGYDPLPKPEAPVDGDRLSMRARDDDDDDQHHGLFAGGAY